MRALCHFEFPNNPRQHISSALFPKKEKMEVMLGLLLVVLAVARAVFFFSLGRLALRSS